MILSIFVLGYVLNTVRRARGTETCKMIFGKILCTVFSSSILTFTPTVLFHEVYSMWKISGGPVNYQSLVSNQPIHHTSSHPSVLHIVSHPALDVL